ncbi:PepX_C domain-containing protein, partial [Haematococcus lacustris]
VKWLEAGEIAEVQVMLNTTSNLFKQGHRLRLDVSCSSFPRYDINYGVTSQEHAEWE